MLNMLAHNDNAPLEHQEIRLVRDSLNIDFVVQDKNWNVFLSQNQDKMADIIIACFKHSKTELPSGQDNHIAIILTDDADIQAINNQWRNLNKPTNVLSFPVFERHEITDKSYLSQPILEFGDIIIAWNYCQNESNHVNIPFDEHILHMIVHGTLHILGYDHINMLDAQIMEPLEVKILKEFGLENPYSFNDE